MEPLAYHCSEFSVCLFSITVGQITPRPHTHIHTYVSSLLNEVLKLSSFLLCPVRLSLQTVQDTHNTPLFTELRQRLQQATGDLKYSPDAEDAVTFVTTTNRKAAIMVSRVYMCVGGVVVGGWGGGGGGG